MPTPRRLAALIVFAFVAGLALSWPLAGQTAPALSRVRASLDSAQSIAAKADSDLAAARASVTALSASVTALQTRVSTLTATVASRDATIVALRDSIGVLNALLAKLPKPAPAPTPAVAPWYALTFDAYTTATWRASKLPSYAPTQQVIDRAMPAPPNGAASALRYDYPGVTATDPTRCQNNSVGFTPLGDGRQPFPTGTREVWTELWIRWQPGFDTRPPWPCVGTALSEGAPDHKIWRLYARAASDGSVQYHSLNVGNQGSAFLVFGGASAYPQAGAYLASNVHGPDVWTGQWIRLRFHDRLSCGLTPTGVSTVDVAWFDGAGPGATKVREVRLVANGTDYGAYGPAGKGVPYDGTALVNASTGGAAPCAYDYMRVGLNRNQRMDRDLALWIGGLRVWLTDPKWAD